MSILGAIGGIAGSVLGGLFGNSQADKQADLQKEFAKNGVRWKVEDAKAAGIHPLYALGAQTTAYSPISVGTPDFATAGQNLGTAIHAATTKQEKVDGYTKTAQQLTLQNMGLQNDLLASQIAAFKAPGRGPGLPGGQQLIPGQGSTQVMRAGGEGGLTIEVDPRNTPAQKVEDQYGEVAGDSAGVLNVVNDMMKTQGTPYPHEVPAYVWDWLTKQGIVTKRNYTRPAPPRRKY